MRLHHLLLALLFVVLSAESGELVGAQGDPWALSPVSTYFCPATPIYTWSD